MADVILKKIEQLEYYSGPKAVEGMRYRCAAKNLGVTAWGMAVIEIEPGCDKYPEHDHTSDGQEEVYTVLRGAGTLKVGDEEMKVEAGMLIRVGPTQKRKFLPGPQGLTLLAIGSTPGKAYQPKR
jgi:mannose-6-phosphate isomerase-like protein (cupin superfamily)